MKDYRRYSDYEDKPEFLTIKYEVNSKEEKEELLKSFLYLHNFTIEGKDGNLYSLDTDIMVVNYLMHSYLNPEFIEVNPKSLNIKYKVKSEEEKEELIKGFLYLHNFMIEGKDGNFYCLDTYIKGVNCLMHSYLNPEFIEVDTTLTNN
jgi:hypothetical protein